MISYLNACPCCILVSHTLFYLLWLTQILWLGRQKDAVLNPCLILAGSRISVDVSLLGDRRFWISQMGTTSHCEGRVIYMSTVCYTEALSLFFFNTRVKGVMIRFHHLTENPWNFVKIFLRSDFFQGKNHKYNKHCKSPSSSMAFHFAIK